MPNIKSTLLASVVDTIPEMQSVIFHLEYFEISQGQKAYILALGPSALKSFSSDTFLLLIFLFFIEDFQLRMVIAIHLRNTL